MFGGGEGAGPRPAPGARALSNVFFRYQVSSYARAHIKMYVYTNTGAGPGAADEVYTQIQARAPGLLTKLEAILQDREYLVKNTFSVADVAVCLSLSLSSFDLPFFL